MINNLPLGNNPFLSMGYMNNVSFGLIHNAFNSGLSGFNQNLGLTGISLFNNSPGRVFNLGNIMGLGSNGSGYYYNSGNDSNGFYVPPFSVGANGSINIEGLRDISQAVRPKTPEQAEDHFNRSVKQLDLIPNGDGTFRRDGFNGVYSRTQDGGIEFSGGSHARSRGVSFERQVYYNGYWHRLGNTSSSLPSSGADNFVPRKSNNGLGSDFNSSSSVNKFERSESSQPFPVKLSVIQNPKLSRSKINIKTLSHEEKISLAKGKETPPETLEELAHDKDESIRMSVASNEGAPPKVLEMLSKDESRVVRWDLARNKKIPFNVLEQLLNDTVSLVRSSAIANLKNRGVDERKKIATSETTRISVLRELLNDPDPTVRASAQKNLNSRR